MAALLAALMVPAAALGQVAMEVSPLRVELKTKPGGQYTQAVTLTNHGKEPVRIRANVTDWYLSKDGTPQFAIDATAAKYSASSWLRVNPPESVVQPEGSAVVRFTMNAPAGTKDGGYRTAIMFDVAPATGDITGRGHDVVFKTRVATLVYVTVGVPQPAVELIDVQPVEAKGQPPRVAATLKNTGAVQVRTKGQVIILDQSGAQLRRVSMPDVPVLPESERDVIVDLIGEGKPPLPPGEYRVEVRIDVGLRELLVGETTLMIGR